MEGETMQDAAAYNTEMKLKGQYLRACDPWDPFKLYYSMIL